MSSDTNTKELIDKEEQKKKEEEEEVEEEVSHQHKMFFTERWHRDPIDYKGPKGRLERLGDTSSDWKSWVTPVPKGMTFELFVDKQQRLTNQWRGLPVYRQWIDTIKQTVWQQQKLKITSCMCLGLGSFSGSNACM